MKDTNNVYSIEGTFAHALGSHCLLHNTNPADYAGMRAEQFLPASEVGAYMAEDYGDDEWARDYFNQLVVDPDMVVHISNYVDYVRSLVGPDDILMVEQRFDLSSVIGEECGGTADVVIIRVAARRLTVIDLKYGQGHRVIAENNKQEGLYGFGALENVVDVCGFEIDDIELCIYQPRKDHIDIAPAMTVQELRDFAAVMSIRAVATRDPDAVATPGEDQCRWCLAKGTCPEYARDVAEIVTGAPVTDADFAAFDTLEALPTALLGVDDIARILPKLDYIRDWCDAVRTAAVREAEFGNKIPGWKMVAGKRGARQWSDPKQVEAIVRNSMRIPIPLAYKMSLISPTQAEKAFKPKQYERLKEFIEQPDGKPALVPESDKRPELQIGVADDEFQSV